MTAYEQQQDDAPLILGFIISSAILSVIAGDKAKDAYKELKTLATSIQRAQ